MFYTKKKKYIIEKLMTVFEIWKQPWRKIWKKKNTWIHYNKSNKIWTTPTTMIAAKLEHIEREITSRERKISSRDTYILYKNNNQ